MLSIRHLLYYLTFLGLIFFSGCDLGIKEVPAESPDTEKITSEDLSTEVVTSSSSFGSFDNKVLLNGTILPHKKVQLKMETDGLATSFQLRDGSYITKGNKVIQLDDKELTYDLALLQSEYACLLYTSPSPRDRTRSRMPSSA